MSSAGRDAIVRGSAAYGLRKIKSDRKPMEDELRKTTDPDANVRRKAIVALEWIPRYKSEVMPRLTQIARDDEDADVRAEAANSLRRMMR